MRLILCFATLVLASDNFTKYQEYLTRFAEDELKKKEHLWYNQAEWNTTKIAGEKMYFSSVPENCPKPTNGVPLWDPPKDEIYKEKCLANLKNKKKKREQLLEAMRPAKHGYPPICVFFHVTLNVTIFFTRGVNEFIFETQLQKINQSKLLDHASLVVRIGLLDEKINKNLTECVKINIRNRIEWFAKGAEIEWVNPSLYECGTISSLRLWCFRNKGSLVLYLHNKGVSRFNNHKQYMNVKDWREYMMFYLVERWNLCANVLMNGGATCGVHLLKLVPYPHYSGNFWWTSCEHVLNNRKPCPNGRKFRHAAEFWLISDRSTVKDKPAVELWDGAPGYGERYPRDKYNCVDKLISNHSWRLND